MTLTKIIEEINKVSVFANEDTDSGPMETLNTRRGRKARSVESLKSLKEEYTSELMRSAVFMVVTGQSRDAFTSTAAENFGCFTADSEAFYRDLADRMPTSLYQGKESVSNLFNILGRHLEDKALEMKILGYPQLIFKQQYQKAINSKDEFVQLIKQALNEQVGAELVGINAIRSIVDLAIARKHADKTTPVVLNTLDEKLALDLIPALERLTSKVFLVFAGKVSKQMKTYEGAVILKDVDVDAVKQALASIRGSLKR